MRPDHSGHISFSEKKRSAASPFCVTPVREEPLVRRKKPWWVDFFMRRIEKQGRVRAAAEDGGGTLDGLQRLYGSGEQTDGEIQDF